jgi:drug/metabolite transporter (DMT)-like permease
VFALVGGFLILQEYMSWKELSGAALMLIGVIITQYFPERKQQT